MVLLVYFPFTNFGVWRHYTDIIIFISFIIYIINTSGIGSIDNNIYGS